MKTLRFEGYSDDTFGEYGITNKDHDNCADGKSIVFRVSAEGRSLLVVGHYAPRPIPTGAGWLVGGAMGDVGRVEFRQPRWCPKRTTLRFGTS